MRRALRTWGMVRHQRARAGVRAQGADHRPRPRGRAERREASEMSHVEATFGEGWVELSFDEGLYPKDAVYGAAYVFIDRCYVHLDRKGDRQIAVRLRGKR